MDLETDVEGQIVALLQHQATLAVMKEFLAENQALIILRTKARFEELLIAYKSGTLGPRDVPK